MTPGSFEYHRPSTVDEAVKLLGTLGDNARVLAGGHSLVPMMKLRLAVPEHLIDINRIGEIKGVSEKDGMVAIGAGTTQAEAVASGLLGQKCPIIAEAIGVPTQFAEWVRSDEAPTTTELMLSLEDES